LDRQIDREVQENAADECRSERGNVVQHVGLPFLFATREVDDGLLPDARTTKPNRGYFWRATLATRSQSSAIRSQKALSSGSDTIVANLRHSSARLSLNRFEASFRF
jgi:hypothetical protein